MAILICSLATTLPAWGFEKDAHRFISANAVQVYRQLYPAEAEKYRAFLDEFIEASVDEDGGLQRPFNWHFYNNSGNLGSTWWGADKHNLPRFKKLANLMKDAGNSASQGRYELAGRLAHHIQDMSSPPHTIPVYHLAKDPFDKYATREIPSVRLSPTDLTTIREEYTKPEKADPEALFHKSAKATLKRVEPKPASGSKGWSGFWRKYDPKDTECGEQPKEKFGCYGKYVFGAENAAYSKDTYLTFYKEQIASAIRDTVQMLVMVGR